MTNNEVIKLIEDKLSKVLSAGIVKELTNEIVTDFARGRIRGKYEALNELLVEIKNIKKNQK